MVAVGQVITRRDESSGPPKCKVKNPDGALYQGAGRTTGAQIRNVGPTSRPKSWSFGIVIDWPDKLHHMNLVEKSTSHAQIAMTDTYFGPRRQGSYETRNTRGAIAQDGRRLSMCTHDVVLIIVTPDRDDWWRLAHHRPDLCLRLAAASFCDRILTASLL